MENSYAENMKSAVGTVVRGALSILGILLFLLFCSMFQKCAQENRTYESVDQIIEENYHASNAKTINNDEYYYILLGNKEELIHFEDGKYFAFDGIQKNFSNIGSSSAGDASNEIGITFIDVYSYEDDIIMTAYRYADEESVGIYDNYGRWKAALMGDKYFYLAVRSKEQFTDDYQLLAKSRLGDFDIGTMLMYRIKDLGD